MYTWSYKWGHIGQEFSSRPFAHFASQSIKRDLTKFGFRIINCNFSRLFASYLSRLFFCLKIILHTFVTTNYGSWGCWSNSAFYNRPSTCITASSQCHLGAEKIFGLNSLEVMEGWGKVQGNGLHNFDRARRMHGGDGKSLLYIIREN